MDSTAFPSLAVEEKGLLTADDALRLLTAFASSWDVPAPLTRDIRSADEDADAAGATDEEADEDDDEDDLDDEFDDDIDEDDLDDLDEIEEGEEDDEFDDDDDENDDEEPADAGGSDDF
jgi:hypothetical protein